MEKADLTKSLKDLYRAGHEIEEVIAERGVFFCVDGRGDPGGDVFQRAVEQLKQVAYTVRARLKKAGRLQFRISKLECRWMCDPGETPREKWLWRVLVRVPEEVTQNDLREARTILRDKKGLDVSAVKRVSWREGRALQVMHVGPYGQVSKVYADLRAEAETLGYRVKGPGHEIYINDPRRVEPVKLKTIVRLPIAWPRPDYARGGSRR
ncbi:hypothetical protein AMJ71_07725 [candidate division TA06 bacterium SM1_40]|uniref:GyrI-like small molecule binding domain-containing protein n=2 Tax=Bacteria division TA06 TaxID=1156500 RepID=A0A0S8JJX2_UNCT6|nr:MAG: hypothetical protein AMJ82_11160 [candidate division TA06 bacterium SM23_40]KPL08942.1 MAG: hypothetical protein AMJ71_07725 [candidate division TA06 bacterium SM1_40]